MKVYFVLLFGLISMIGTAQKNEGFKIVERKDKKQVDVLYNGKLLTAYCFYDSIRKPFLYPINTVDGITVTRGYPEQPRPGERTDHPHHIGLWLNYESVNGLDFWNNSTAIPLERRSHYGTIFHDKIINKKESGNNASLTVSSKWITPEGDVLIQEKTIFNFSVKNNDFIIDRIATLTANNKEVVFKDVKDGMLAIRVARELEMPSKEKSNYIDDKGNVTTVANMPNDNVTGMYYSSEGLKGDSVWGTKAKWVILSGKKNGRDISIAIFDHPTNVGYPAYWHARGYGLFAVNPLGRKIFSKGTEELNFTLKPAESATFRYRILIHSGDTVAPATMNALASDFEKVK